MAFDFFQNVQFSSGFSGVQEGLIRSYMQTAYEKSPKAKAMFEQWGQVIKVKYVTNAFQALNGQGIIQIDLNRLNNLSYINDKGKAVPYSLFNALLHELGHALTGKGDPSNQSPTSTDYLGDDQRYVNQIWEELRNNGISGMDKEISYIATAKDDTANQIGLQRLFYDYTNGKSIDNAVNVEAQLLYDWDSIPLGASKDLLIGGPNANILKSGDGNDFLFGGGGDDVLDGGNGIDTAVYFGSKLDYDIRKNTNGTWTIGHKRGDKNDGTDTLKNIEYAQFYDGNFLFPGKETYQLAANGLTFQNDFALVIDTTGSMGSSIDTVKTQAASLIEAVFANGNSDGRIGVVSFKDTTNGEPSQVILPFTEQDEFADRKAAALAAINSLTVGGGGDQPETDFDGLRTALNGSMGQWRFGAGTLRIALFTDAPVKDVALAGEVTTLAQSIGATIASSSVVAGTGGSVSTFNLKLASSSSLAGVAGSIDPNPIPSTIVPLTAEPITANPTTAQVQIFTIFTGYVGTDTAALSQIAQANGGALLTAPTNDELVKQLLAIITAPPVVRPPTIDIGDVTKVEGNVGTTNFDFDITLSKPSSETIIVKYNTADVSATAGSDYKAETGTVTFNPGETSKTVSISVGGDTNLELDETFTITLTDAVGGKIDKATGIGSIIDDDRPIVATIATDANASEFKKDPGLFTLTRTGATAKGLTVNYTIAGTANNNTDYKNITGTATFKAGSSQTTIEIKPIDDEIYEGDETVTLTLNDGGVNYKIDPLATTGTVTITDDDLPSISLSVTDDKAAETKNGEVANSGQFRLKRTGITTEALTVKYTLDGTASNGIDYQKLESSITFAAGSDTAFIDIKPIDDQFFEGTETVKLKLTESSKYTIEEQKSGTVKIADNDNPKYQNLKVEDFDETNSRIGTKLQTGTEGEVIDLRGFDGRVLKVDTLTANDSTYKNYIGFYAVEDERGTLASGLKVGDVGYAEAAIKGALLHSFKNESNTDLNVTGGKILAPVVIANGTFEDYLKRNPLNQANSDIHAYFNYIGANTDKVDHFKLLGDNKFGVEDMYGGGDRDYNDIIVQLAVRS